MNLSTSFNSKLVGFIHMNSLYHSALLRGHLIPIRLFVKHSCFLVFISVYWFGIPLWFSKMYIYAHGHSNTWRKLLPPSPLFSSFLCSMYSLPYIQWIKLSMPIEAKLLFITDPSINSFCEGKQCRVLWKQKVPVTCFCWSIRDYGKEEVEGIYSSVGTSNIFWRLIHILRWHAGSIKKFFWLLCHGFFCNIPSSVDLPNPGNGFIYRKDYVSVFSIDFELPPIFGIRWIRCSMFKIFNKQFLSALVWLICCFAVTFALLFCQSLPPTIWPVMCKALEP